jgi:putative aldouronate transport system permease protein
VTKAGTLAQGKVTKGSVHSQPLGIRVRQHWPFYLFLLPAIIWYAVFAYYPIAGLQIAFKKFSNALGIWGSPWVGLKYFRNFLSDKQFWKFVQNTLTISFSKLFFCFPAPIILALMLNAVRSRAFKRTIQTVSYLPHFISWVVVISLIQRFFSQNIGLINDLRLDRGLDTIYFLGQKRLFIPFIVLSDMWKGVGYGSIIYLAALAGIDPTLYEAAGIDGANGSQKLWHVTLPGIKATIGIMFLLNIGGLFSVNFEQVLLLQTPPTYDVSEVIDTYILRRGLKMNQFDYAAAVSLFRGVLSMLLVVMMNYISRRVTEVSLW